MLASAAKTYDRSPTVLIRTRGPAGRWPRPGRGGRCGIVNPVEHLLEEAGDDHADGLLAGQAAAAGVEDLLVVHPAGRGPVRALHVVGLDLQAGDRVGPGVFGEDQVVVALVAVGLLGVAVDLDHAPPHQPRVVLQGALVEQVAGAVRRLVVLQRVVGEVLLAFGEHHAVDLRVGARADQGHVLVDLGQAAAQGADGPLQRGVVADQGLLVGEVPDAGAPVLQVDVAEPRPRPDVGFRSPRSASRRPPASVLAVSASTVASAPSSSTISEWPKSTPPGDRAESMCSGRSIDHALGHVEQRCRPTSRRRAARRTCRRGNRPPGNR